MNDSSDLLKKLSIDRSAPLLQRQARRRWPWLVGALALIAVLVGGGWWLFGGAQAIAVRTATAIAPPADGSLAASVLDATGYVVARRQATVSAKITGKVEQVLIEEGQRVEAGQVLARLEPTDAEAQRDLSASQLAAARTQVTQVQAQLLLAEKSLVRSRDLAARRLEAQQLLDQAQSERDALAAQLASAQRNVEVAADSLKLSDIGIDNTIVRAPFAGVITEKAAQPGEIVSPVSAGGGFTRTGIGTVVDMDSLEIEVDVNEAFIGRVKPRQPVEAVLNAYPDWEIPAEVIAIIPTADRSKATVKVRIALKQKDARIVPEMGVRVAFLDTTGDGKATAVARPRGVLVPAEAVVEREGKAMVFVVNDRRAKLREVQAQAARSGQRLIGSGLAANEIVVVTPPADLKDGAAVTTE